MFEIPKNRLKEIEKEKENNQYNNRRKYEDD